MLTHLLEPEDCPDEEQSFDADWESLLATLPPDLGSEESPSPPIVKQKPRRNVRSLAERVDEMLSDTAYIAYPITERETYILVKNLTTGSQYLVNYHRQTCNCPAFRAGRDRLPNGCPTCKHLEGLVRLMEASVARMWELRDGVRAQLPFRPNACYENYRLATMLDNYANPATIFPFGSTHYHLAVQHQFWGQAIFDTMMATPQAQNAMRERRAA